MRASDVQDEIRRIEESIEALKRKYGSFERLYRYVEYGEPQGFNVDEVEAWDDLWRWKNLQYKLEELKKNMKE